MRQYPLCCGNSKCQTSQTPLWRKGWVNSDGKTVMLCNACGLHYKKGHYCMYCNQIYRESDADDHSNPWIGCDRCSRWVHQNCEEQNGHDCKKQKSYLCPDCRSIGDCDTTSQNASPTAITTSSNPGKASAPSVIKKRRKTPSGSRDVPDSPTPLQLPLHRLSQFSPMTPTSPISPGSNFMMYSQQQRQPSASTPTTPASLFDPNTNVMPCWSQLKSSIQNLPSSFNSSPSTPTSTSSRKRKNASLDGTTSSSTTTASKKQKKSRTTTISSSITTTTTHRVNSAGIDALMGAVMADQVKQQQQPQEDVPQLELKLSTSAKKGKQTPRKMNAEARTAAIALSSTDTPTTPTTLFSPSLFATTTTTTTTTTLVPRVDDIMKSNVSLSEEQFYKYQQLMLQQKQNNTSNHHDGDGELSNDSISSVSSTATDTIKPTATLLPNTFGSVDTLGNFYGSFNEQQEKEQQLQPQDPEASPYGMMDDDDDFSSIASLSSDQRRPQKRMRRPSPKKVTTTTTLTMTTTVSSTKSKRIRERMAKNGGSRTVYASSSETEDSDYDNDVESQTLSWSAAAKALNISLDEAHDVLTSRFPQAPVLKKIGSLWAVCEIIRGQERSV